MNATQAVDRLRQAIRRQHKAFSTEDSYVFWLRRYLKALAAMDPALSSDKKVESFLTQLARAGLSASSQTKPLTRSFTFIRKFWKSPWAGSTLCEPRRPFMKIGRASCRERV